MGRTTLGKKIAGCLIKDLCAEHIKVNFNMMTRAQVLTTFSTDVWPTTARCLAITEEIVPTAVNNVSADSIISNPMDDHARAVGSKRRMAVEKDVFGVHVKN